MLRRLSYPVVICCLAAITMYFANSNNQAADPPADGKRPAAPSVPPQASTSEIDPFAVPDGNDEQALHLFLVRATQIPPEGNGRAAEIAHFQRLDRAIEEVLSRDISEQFFAQIGQLRFQIISVLDQIGDKTAVDREKEFVTSLKENGRPAAQMLFKAIEMQQVLFKFSKDSPQDQHAFILGIVEQMKSLPKENDEELQNNIDLAMDAGSILERSGSELTIPAYKTFVAALAERNDPRLKNVITSFERTLVRLSLRGTELNLQGTAMTGKPFDIKEYRGKVVLIDFWATWCKGCVQELPHLKEVYEFYHDKGLEVVGINTDHQRELAARFIVEQKIPWVNLFEESEDDSGELSSLATRFGITVFPTMMLLDQQGKVITVQIGGLGGSSDNTSMEAELARLLGPMPKSIAPPGLDNAPVEQ